MLVDQLATSIAARPSFFQRLLGRLVPPAVGRMRKLAYTKHFAALHRATDANADTAISFPPTISESHGTVPVVERSDV